MKTIFELKDYSELLALEMFNFYNKDLTVNEFNALRSIKLDLKNALYDVEQIMLENDY